ncbi:hypothetical protein SSTU70S_05751 [Stutzerimonas stutzeri]
MIKAILASLPQANAIAQDDAERWVSAITKWHGDRADWHAKRLFGFGGSEIGAVIRGVKGLSESGFSNITQVVEQKLMRRLPLRENEHMKRGTVLEHLARLAFLYRYGAEQDHAATNAMQLASPRKGFEWLVGNPDDLVVLQGRRFVVDYKVPSTYTDEIPFDYEAQLHHYGLIARNAGVALHGQLLTKLDLAPEIAAGLVARLPTMTDEQVHEMARTIARTDIPGLRVVSHVVETSRDMQLDILECGRYAWEEMVLQGVVPNVKSGASLPLTEDKQIEIGRYQQQYAMAKAGVKYLTEIATQAQQAIESALDGVEFQGKQFPISLVTVAPNNVRSESLVNEALQRGAKHEELVSSDRKYSVVALIEEIKRLNGDPEDTRLFEVALDPKKAQAFLVERGVDLEPLRQPGVSLRISTKKADRGFQEVFERSAADQFGHWLDASRVAACLEDDGLESIELGESEAATGTLLEAFAADIDQLRYEEDIQPQTPMNKSAGLR